jgi:hypothetical protein
MVGPSQDFIMTMHVYVGCDDSDGSGDGCGDGVERLKTYHAPYTKDLISVLMLFIREHGGLADLGD